MKKIFLFFGSILWISSAQALFLSEDVIRTEHRFWVEGTSDQLVVEVHQTFENTHRRPRSVQLWEPLGTSASEVKVFVNAQGWPFDVFVGEEARERMFYQAQEAQDPRFFRLVVPPFDRVLRPMEIPIPPKSSVKVKLTYQLKPDFVEGLYFSEFFVDDEIPSSSFEMAFRVGSTGNIQHFLTNLPQEQAYLEPSGEEVLYLFRHHKQPLSGQNVRVFWSELEEPVLHFPTNNGTFVGRFGALPSKKEHEEVLFLIDRSGSMLGRPWERTEEWLTYLFEQLPVGARLQVGFFGEGIEFLEEDFVPNRFSFRKEVFEYLKSIKPLGKSPFGEALSEVSARWTVPFDKRLLVIIGDIGEVQIQEASLSAPTALLDFSTQVTSFQDLVRQKDGFVVRLFQSPRTLVEKPVFDRFWNQWWEKSFGGQALFLAEEQEVEPEQFQNAFQYQAPFFVGRTWQSVGDKIESMDFLPSLWAGRRIGKILADQVLFSSKEEGEEALEERHQQRQESIDALLSLGRTFGVETSFFNNHTTRDQLEQTLDKSVDAREWSQEYQRLVHPTNIDLSASVRRVQGIPLYYEKSEKVWRSYDFFDRARADTLLVLAPASDVLKDLYLRFPRSFTKLLGVGNQVDFCFSFRCVSVRQGGREYPVQKDDLFWHFAPPRDHWAYASVLRLLDKGALLFPENGDLELDQAISRAGFLEILGRSYFGEDFKWTGNLNQFRDIDSTHPFAKAIGFFAEKGIVKGYGPDNGPWEFRPGQSLTRAEAVKILLMTKGMSPSDTENAGDPIFADTDDWARPWVEEAFRRRLVKGYDEDGVRTFHPHEPLTRGEAFVLMSR